MNATIFDNCAKKDENHMYLIGMWNVIVILPQMMKCLENRSKKKGWKYLWRNKKASDPLG